MATAKKTAESSANPDKTRLDEDNTKPATVAPGDAPADTTDPTERASTVGGVPGPEALAAGTVNATVPLPPLPSPRQVAEKDQRVEQYPAVRPDGTEVTVEHNIDTGETRIV